MIADLAYLASECSDPLVLAGGFLVASFLVTRLVLRRHPMMRFLGQVAAFAGFSIILVMAGVIPSRPTPAMDATFKFVAISIFKIVWWIAAAWLLVVFFRIMVFFERKPSETRFLQDLFAGAVYVGAALAIIAYVFDMPISGLLAASGVIAIVLGLALQSTLGDVFSGVVLDIAKPYHPGDWLILDGGLQGRVVETNWRATQLLTPNKDLATIPNSVIAKATLINASNPQKAHGVTITARLEPTVVPSHGCAVLETALLSSNRILRNPAPSVTVKSMDAVALECELQFFVDAMERVSDAQNELFDLVFRHCLSAGIRLAPPRGSLSTLPPRSARQDPGELPRLILERLPIFAPLTDEERASLAPKMRRRSYRPGEVLVAQGTVAAALYILGSGALVALQDSDAGEGEVIRLSPGDCFGEASVLTGDASQVKVSALTKAVVYEIAKDDLAPILKERPAIATELGQILARREAAGKERLERQADHDNHRERLARRFAERMKELFGVT